MIQYDLPTIDSFSLSIPIENCEIINDNFLSRVVTYYYDTDTFDDELQNAKPLVFTYDGITIRFRIAEKLNGKTLNKFIIVTISSKLLKSRYFEGITLNNIELIYKEIHSLNVFKCSYSDFLDSYVSDVDLCLNYKISEETFLNANKKLISFSLPGKNRFFNLFEKKDKFGNYINLGLDINTRPKAKPSTPYIKNYYKTIELTTKSLEFYTKFLKNELHEKNQSIRNLARIEYTIKGYKQKERLQKRKLLKTSYKTLSDLLNLKPKEMSRIIYSGFSEYCLVPKRDYQKNNYKSLSPQDSLILNYMGQLLNKGADKIDLYEILNSFEGNRKSRLKSKIDTLYKHLITDNLSLKNQMDINEELNKFLDKLR